jgi:hypothetical protein
MGSNYEGKKTHSPSSKEVIQNRASEYGGSTIIDQR